MHTSLIPLTLKIAVDSKEHTELFQNVNHDMHTCMKVLVETLKCNIYIKEEIEEIVEVYTVTACICACTHAWYLACMNAPFVLMLVGVCTSVHACSCYMCTHACSLHLIL